MLLQQLGPCCAARHRKQPTLPPRIATDSTTTIIPDRHTRSIGFGAATQTRLLVERTKAEVAGTLLTAQLALKHGLACNTAGAAPAREVHASSECAQVGGAHTCTYRRHTTALTLTPWRGAARASGGTHHAFADAGSGFCILNDLAFTAAALLQQGAVSRVLILDLDVHQASALVKGRRAAPLPAAGSNARLPKHGAPA
jgi:hypothetical protein